MSKNFTNLTNRIKEKLDYFVNFLPGKNLSKFLLKTVRNREIVGLYRKHFSVLFT